VETPAHSARRTEIDPRIFTEKHSPTRRDAGKKYLIPETDTSRGRPLIIVRIFKYTY
jgi:hypothetical protein